MDALYFFRHSSFDDIELRYSLRSVAKHMPWIRKVWIFGDRPAFLSDDVALVEHVPHEYVARIGKYRTPVTNFFLMFHLSSLIPDLTSEFVFFSDDFICLSDVSVEQAVLTRCIDDMSVSHWQPRGIWQTTLRRTHELLQRLGYPTYNFETHCPTYFRRKWIFDAWCDFRDFVTEDRWYGPTGPTAILNHACLHEKFDVVFREEEGLWIGFHGREPSETDIAIGTQNRKFLNFDDDAFGPAIQRYLEGKFPDSCRYEKVDPDMPLRGATGRVSDKSCQNFAVQRYPAPILSDRRRIAPLLNQGDSLNDNAESG